MPSSSLSVYVSIEGALGSHTYIPHTLITLISYLFLLILATIMLKMSFQYLATKRMRCCDEEEVVVVLRNYHQIDEEDGPGKGVYRGQREV